jgi:hypothetical protein
VHSALLYTPTASKIILAAKESSLKGADELIIEEIIHGVEMIVDFDLRSVIAGTRSIARAVHHLPTYLDECENSEADLKTLESWAHIFIEPVNLVQTIAGNAIHNLPKVSVDVLKARRDLK